MPIENNWGKDASHCKNIAGKNLLLNLLQCPTSQSGVKCPIMSLGSQPEAYYSSSNNVNNLHWCAEMGSVNTEWLLTPSKHAPSSAQQRMRSDVNKLPAGELKLNLQVDGWWRRGLWNAIGTETELSGERCSSSLPEEKRAQHWSLKTPPYCGVYEQLLQQGGCTFTLSPWNS